MKEHKLYETWNKVPADYYQEGTKKNIFQFLWHRQKINLAKKIIRNLQFRNCLDIGCASGYMTWEIHKAFPNAKYFGVDIFDKAIEYAKRKYPNIEFKVSFADDLPFPKNYFDLVLFYETIEHVEDPKKALEEIKRILKKDGTLILTMDSGNWLFRLIWFIWEKSFGSVWKGAHLHPFHHSELEKLITNVGFNINKKLFSHLGMEVTFILQK